MEFRERMRLIRGLRGMSQQDVATAVGCSQPFVHMIERGLHKPSDELKANIVQALGWTPEMNTAVDSLEDAAAPLPEPAP